MFIFPIFQCVEDSYDIPRSHQMPYYNLNENNSISPTLIADRNQITSSTPNLSDVTTSAIPKRSHFYSNAAPSKMDGNVFRYDFVEQVRHTFISHLLSVTGDLSPNAIFFEFSKIYF